MGNYKQLKQLSVITLDGTILREIEEEGRAQGKDWRVRRLYITRNEKSPKNIEKKLAKLREFNMNATEEDAKSMLLFSYFRESGEHWRIYSREEADQLKNEIKKARGYI